MDFSSYLENLRRKPKREKERIAIIATVIVFFVVLGIWLLTFSENTGLNNENQSVSSPSVSSQLDDLKNSIGQDKQSIQNMMQSLPQDQNSGNAPSANNPGTASSAQDLNNNLPGQNAPGQNNTNNSNNTSPVPSDGNQKPGQEIPQLP